MRLFALNQGLLREGMRDRMDVHPAQVAALDAEIVRLHHQSRASSDVFERQVARLRIDELLEQRHALTGPAEPPAAEGSQVPQAGPGTT